MKNLFSCSGKLVFDLLILKVPQVWISETKKERDGDDMARGCAAFGNHSQHALCDGKCSILHPQGSQWPRNYQFLFICLHFFRSICFYFLLDLMIMITDIDSWQPKHIGNDVWDVAMERRDKKIMEMLSSPSPSN